MLGMLSFELKHDASEIQLCEQRLLTTCLCTWCVNFATLTA
jgi:hypothetical protein